MLDASRKDRSATDVPDAQFVLPRGPEGHVAGHVMARENAPTAHVVAHFLHVAPEDRVLEIGFGPGVALELLAARATRGIVAGVDPSDVMLAEASARNRRALEDGRMRLVRGNVSRLPFEDGYFTKACAMHNLDLWPDPARDLREVRRVLAPGARLVLATRVRDPARPVTTQGLTANAMRRVEARLADAGFRDVHQRHFTLGGQPAACFIATR